MVFQAVKVWMESGPAYLCGCGTRSSSQRGHLFRCDTDVYRESQTASRTASPKIHRKMWKSGKEWERNQVCRAPSKLLSKWWRRRVQLLKCYSLADFERLGSPFAMQVNADSCYHLFLENFTDGIRALLAFASCKAPTLVGWFGTSVLAQPIDVRMSSGQPLVLYSCAVLQDTAC